MGVSEFWEILLCPGAMSTKSKKADSNSVLSGFRNTNARALALAQVPLRSFAVCSDTQVGKRRKNKNDAVEFDISDLVLPATTDAKELASKTNKVSPDPTYHSIQVISDAQKEYDLPEFDLIICDEAHRTMGGVLGTDKHESEFIKVHDNSIIRGKKRLYMTVTPKIFSDNAKK